MTRTPPDLTFDRLINGLGGSSEESSSSKPKAAGEDESNAERPVDPANDVTPAEAALRLDRARRQAAPTVPVRPRSGARSTKD